MSVEVPHFVPAGMGAIAAFAGATSTPPVIAIFLWITFVALLLTLIVHAFAGAAHAVLGVLERARAAPAKAPPKQR
jgi:hypothetical protein